jgi:LysM repeat protein
MTEQYVVKRGDTLSSISKSCLGDPNRYREIAELNGIEDLNKLMIGATLEVPSVNNCEIVQPKKHSLITPTGYSEIVKTFGDVRGNITSLNDVSMAWKRINLSTVELPFKIPLAWNLSQKIKSIRCHKKLVGTYKSLFNEIYELGLHEKITNYGGSFNYRSKRSSNKLSTHSWGIAIDINPLTNRMGTKGDMPYEIVQIFEEYGFEWGGKWRTPDPMHFQFAKRY